MVASLDLFRGDSLPINLEMVSSSSAGEIPFDLTGYTAEVSLRWPKCDRIKLNSSDGALTISATAGVVTGQFGSTTTICLPDAVQMYLVLETTVPSKKTIFLGNVKVMACNSSTDVCSCQ
jgi:hypothetical protein